MFYLLGFSEMTMSRLCNIQATKRKIEHMPNMIVIGKAFTLRTNKNKLEVEETKRVS